MKVFRVMRRTRKLVFSDCIVIAGRVNAGADRIREYIERYRLEQFEQLSLSMN